MAQEEYVQLRQKLAELYAGRRMAGESGLTAAGMQLLRRVENLEAISDTEPNGSCLIGDCLGQLSLALCALSDRPSGWLEVGRFPDFVSVGLTPKALLRAVLNLIRLLEQGHPRTISLQVEQRKSTALCSLRAVGKLLPSQPGLLCPVGQWAENLSDSQLALAAAQATIHRAGGGLVLGSGAGLNTASFWLPLRDETAPLPCPSSRELLEDRFSVVNIVLNRSPSSLGQ